MYMMLIQLICHDTLCLFSILKTKGLLMFCIVLAPFKNDEYEKMYNCISGI